MKAAHPSSSGMKATTQASHLRATAAVGGALIGYLITKTPQARQHLVQLANTAQRTGNLSAGDAAVLEHLLAKPMVAKPTATLYTLN